MSRLLEWTQAGVTLVLWTLLLADVFLFWSNTKLHEQLYHSPLYMYRKISDTPSVPAGYLASGKKVGLQITDAGLVMRYGAKSCLYCKEDEAIWLRLAAGLRQRNFVVVTVPMSAQEEYPAKATALADGPQITFVNTSWIKPLRLRKTPTVLIFAGGKAPVWAHEGRLDASDVQSALKAIDHR